MQPDLIQIPAELEAVFEHFLTCEVTTLTRDATPVTWPMVAYYRPEQHLFHLTTSIGFAQKAVNIRRDSRVSMLYSESIGSGLQNPPAVLLQGHAEVSEQVGVLDDLPGLPEYWRATLARASSPIQISDIPLLRDYLDFYYMRLLIVFTPLRMRWWPQGDFSQPPQERPW